MYFFGFIAQKRLTVPAGMPFSVIEGGVFGAKIVGHRITRRKPPAHFLDAGLAFLCATLFNVFFVK